MSNLTNVEFYYSGGGCVLYSAKFNNEVWISTDFETVYCYDVPSVIADDDFINGIPYESHRKNPSVPLPTWNDIYDSICEHVPSMVKQAKLSMSGINPNKRLTIDE